MTDVAPTQVPAPTLPGVQLPQMPAVGGLQLPQGASPLSAGLPPSTTGADVVADADKPAQPPSIMDRAMDVLGDIGTALTSPSELGKAVVKGSRDFVQQTGHDLAGAASTQGAVEADASAAATGAEPNGASASDQMDFMEKNAPSVPEVDEPHTGTGKFLASTVQFVEGMATLGKFLGPLNAANKAVRAGDMALRSGADFALFFDPYKERLSNLIQEYPSLQNPVAKFLSADPSDPEVLARFKNGLENAGLGVALDSTVQGVAAVSHYMRGNKAEALTAAEAAAGAVPKVSAEAPPDGMLPPDQNPKFIALAKLHQENALAMSGNLPESRFSTMSTENIPLVDGPREFPAAAAPVEFSPKEVSDTADALMGAYAADKADPFNTLSPDISPINLGYVTNPKARASLLTELGARLGQARIARGDVGEAVTNATTLTNGKQLAMQMGMSPNDAMDWASNIVGNVKNAADYVPALKIVTNSIEAQLRQHAQWLAEDRLGPYASKDEFNTAVDALAKGFMDFGKTSEDLGTAGGRLLQAHQITTGQSKAVGEAIGKANMEGSDPDLARELMLRRVAAAPPGVETTAQIVSPWYSGAQKFASYYINSLLGYATVAVKGTSDILKGGIIQPTEQAYKGIYRGLTSNDWTQFTQAGSQVMGLIHGITDSLEFGGRSAYSFGKQAFTSGEQVLDPAGQGFVHQGNSGGELGNLGIMDALERGDYTYATTAAAGVTLNMPTRLINTVHEFSQQTIYRSRVYGKANTEATLQGLYGSDRDNFVQAALKNSFGPNGEALDQEALQYARAGTYSSQLPSNTFSGHVQDYLNDHPLGRVVMPFIKAPANLLYDVYQYTPGVKTAIDGYKSLVSGGGPQAEEAVARLVTGASLWAVPLTLAYNGMLTDGGSNDPHALKEQKETGWLPHSLVLSDQDGTKHYYPIDRIDPFGQILSMGADLHTLMGQVGKDDAGRLATQAVVAISKDSLSKNYLKNFSDLLTALGSRTDQDADSKWQTVLKSMAGGLVPSQLARTNDDPLMRETRGVMDALKARTPGLSATLDRQFNTLGEPISRTPALGPELASPFYQSMDKNDETQAILSHVANTNPEGFKSPPKTMRLDRTLKTPGVDLTSIPSSNGHSAYDRFQELIGDLGNGSPTLRDQIDSTVKGNQAFWKDPQPDGNRDYQGARFMELNSLIGARRMAAEEALKSENKPLMNALVSDMKSGASVLRGGGNAPRSEAPGMKLRP